MYILSRRFAGSVEGTNVSVSEVVPPYVDTELDVGFKEELVKMLGGPEKAPKAIGVEEFVEMTMEGLNALGKMGNRKGRLLLEASRRWWLGSGRGLLGMRWRGLVSMGKGRLCRVLIVAVSINLYFNYITRSINLTFLLNLSFKSSLELFLNSLLLL